MTSPNWKRAIPMCARRDGDAITVEYEVSVHDPLLDAVYGLFFKSVLFIHPDLGECFVSEVRTGNATAPSTFTLKQYYIDFRTIGSEC